MKILKCAVAMVLGAAAPVVAQGPAVQMMAKPSDAAQSRQIAIRDGKVFLLNVPGAPVEGLRLDTSETPLSLWEPSVKGQQPIPRCYLIVNEGPGTMSLTIAPQPQDASQTFAKTPPPSFPPNAVVEICPPEKPVDKAANLVVSTDVPRGTVAPADVISFSAKAPDQERVIKMNPKSDSVRGDRYEAMVRLDGTGISDSRFLNPRRMHRVCVVADTPATCTDQAGGADVDLLFDNTLTDRALEVTFEDVPLDQRGSFLQAGMKVVCSGGTCTASIRLDPKAQKALPVNVLQRAYAQGMSGRPVQFTVSKFIEDVPLANSRGYFTVVALTNTRELASKSAWGFIGQAAGMYEPDLTGLFEPCPPETEDEDCPRDPSITTIRTLDGQQRTHVSGTARLGFTTSMGAKADADVELQIKKGDLGGDEDTVEVTPTKYRLNINASNGSIISGGRYTFAEPGNSIAVSESGEGLSVRYRFFDIGHLFKRETGQGRVQRLLRDTSDGDPENDRDIEDGDHSTTIAQLREVSTAGGHFLLNAIGLNGRSRPQGIRSSYWTVGGDATYLFPRHNMTQTLSWYHSWRNSKAPLKDGTDEARGTVWLLTSNYTNLHRSDGGSDTDFTLAFLVGRGSGDRADTPAKREDYIGETASFTTDLIFLSTLAGSFGIDGVTEGRVGEGLSNKAYVGLLADTARFSPLTLIAKLLRTDDDIAEDGSGTSLRYHWYRLNEPVLGEHFAGQEVDVDFRIESPAKIKYTFSVGVYFPGAAIKPMVTETQWKLQGNLSVKM